jgi:hypothetical protein
MEARMKSDDACRMADLIAARGPMQGTEIRGALDWEFGRIRNAVQTASAWFEFTAAGWCLTPQGQKEFENINRDVASLSENAVAKYGNGS